MDGRQFLGQIEIEDDLRGLELVLEQGESVADDLIQVGLAELGGRGAGEVEQAIGDFGGAEALLRDFVQHQAQAGIALELLGEHLRVGRDDGQGGVDLMRDAGRQQADGAEFIGLGELGFKRDPLGDVVHQDDASHGYKVAREQGGDSDVGGALLAGAGGEAELVEVMHALVVTESFEHLNELGREDVLERLADGLGAAEGVHGLHLRVPAFDAVVEIEGQDAHVDGLDDVFVELLQALEFADFLFQPGVEAGILEGDADVAGERLEQLDVFAGEEIAADGAAQADDGDGARGRSVLYAAREIVVEVEQGGGALLGRRQMQGLLSVFKEDVGVVFGLVEIQEAERQAVLRGVYLSGEPVGRGQAQTAGILGEEHRNSRHQQRAWEALHNG